jgi:putative heme-binding domain-containing protein
LKAGLYLVEYPSPMKKIIIFPLVAAALFHGAISAQVTDKTAEFKVAAGFKLEQIYEVKKEEGSWVALTEDGQGRLIAADQYGGLFRITVPALTGGETKVEALDIPIGGAHGLLWHEGTLYIVINERSQKNPVETGVWKAKETATGYEKPELVKAIKAGGEHGVHSLVLSPDKKWIYLITGNYAQLPEISDSFAPKVWQEDQLVPRNPDGKGHAANVMAPGGLIMRFQPDGSNWQLVSIGQRNTYDAAFHDSGELFSYDADMEWDFGMPWYRPTRICHVVPGIEQGWRNGSGKWPAYYEDSMDGVLNIGPGSPTGVVAGRGFKAPAKYQQAIYAFDWTFATIYAVHLTPDGSSFKAEKEEFVAGAGLPLTDAVIGKDGSMYFATGGRRGKSHLWRVVYTGKESTAPQLAKSTPNPTRDKLAEMIRDPKKFDADLALKQLSSEERTLRFMARTALERSPDAGWIAKISAQKDAWSQIHGAMALARLDGKKHRTAALEGLMKVDWKTLSQQQQINWLRAAGLIFIRGGEPSDAERLAAIAKIDASYPSKDRAMNFELARMLCYLQAPSVVSRTLKLMDEAPASDAEDWKILVERNSRYGNDINAVIKNHPPTAQIHYLYCLRAVKGPWKADERRRVFNWFREIDSRSGGNSYSAAIAMIRKQIYENGTPEEQKLFAADAKAPAQKPKALPPVKGPGRDWTVEEIKKVAAEGLTNRNLENGKAMFEASLCSACHKFGSEGGAQGPDLTNLAGRFKIEDLAHSIIDPSQVISDQYEFTEIVKHDGTTTTGRILNEQDEILVVGINPFDFTQQIEIGRNDIKSKTPSKVSPMPPAMINRLNADELKDLFAYLLGVK